MNIFYSVFGGAIGGYAWGLWMGLRHHRIRKDAGRPICGCHHDRSFHEDTTGRCRYRSEWSGRCQCQAYTGPVPLDPGYYAPEITQ